jgi:hypothetical protein
MHHIAVSVMQFLAESELFMLHGPGDIRFESFTLFDLDLELFVGEDQFNRALLDPPLEFMLPGFQFGFRALALGDVPGNPGGADYVAGAVFDGGNRH